jgi:hypothetical protein
MNFKQLLKQYIIESEKKLFKPYDQTIIDAIGDEDDSLLVPLDIKEKIKIYLKNMKLD